MVQITEISAASGVDEAGDQKRISAGLTGAGIERNTEVHWSSIGELEERVLVLVGCARVSLVVVPDLVVADVGAGQKFEIHSDAVGVNRGFVVFEQRLFRPLVNGGEDRSLDD